MIFSHILTLFLPDLVTRRSYKGWFHPWPVGIGSKRYISNLGLFGKTRQYDNISSILVNYPSFEVAFVMSSLVKQTKIRVSALKDDWYQIEKNSYFSFELQRGPNIAFADFGTWRKLCFAKFVSGTQLTQKSKVNRYLPCKNPPFVCI